MSRKSIFLLAVALLAGALLLAACQQRATPAPAQIVEVTIEVPVEVTRQVEVPVTVEPAAEAPFLEIWLASAHADRAAEAFVHWNEDDPAEVPPECARCHSGTGYQDFIGADGSAAGSVENPAPIEDVITCEACHNTATQTMRTVAFPSGAEVTNLGPEARCMQCHQGRASGLQVDAAIQEAGLSDDDTTSEDLGFTNIHYFAAAVARYGTQVKGGYEYAGKSYDVLFEHVRGVDGCADCHDPHSLEVKVDTCAGCHAVGSAADVRNVRMASSDVDYDGDGDIEEGIFYEIETLREQLYQTMQAYASEVAGTPLVYSELAHPYFFIDANANGTLDEGEANSDARYNAWTGRLAKAAFNFQASLKDPGAYVHGGKYIIQLLYDSIEDLNSQLSQPVDMTGMHRIDPGHFAGSEEAFRHWDADGGSVPGTCAKCHSGNGLPTFLANNANIAAPASNGFLCENCHNDLQAFTRYPINNVRFPSGATVSFGEGVDSNLCINCHQGRESTTSVNSAIGGAGVGDDEVSESLKFRNVHYFAAGATLFGDVAKGAYQYEGKTYLGQFGHGDLGPTQCTECHQTHALEIRFDDCTQCHKNAEDVRAIRMSEVDHDGDGDVAEGLASEVTALQDALYAAIQAYAPETAGAGIVYDSHSHPYFFVDANDNGEADPDEVNSDGQYASWTPRLLRAAYNFQYSQKDPGAFAHNGKYILQVLYDSIQDVGGDVSAYTRPE